MKIYNFRIEGKKVSEKENQFSSLYETCKKAIGIQGGLVIESGRLVAFFFSWTNFVKPGFGATAEEKQAILDY